MKCLKCSKEIESKGNRKRQFCSDKCRMAFKRQNQSKDDAPESSQLHEPEPIRTEASSNPNRIESEQSNPNIVNQMHGKPNRVSGVGILLKHKGELLADTFPPCPAGIGQSQWNYQCLKARQTADIIV